jgi:hypothetical protein
VLCLRAARSRPGCRGQRSATVSFAAIAEALRRALGRRRGSTQVSVLLVSVRDLRLATKREPGLYYGQAESKGLRESVAEFAFWAPRGP